MKNDKRYSRATPVPADEMRRLALVVEVLAGKTTVRRAARELGISRNEFERIRRRGLTALLKGISPTAEGQPADSNKMAAVVAELLQLQSDNAELKERIGTTDRLLRAASGLLDDRSREAKSAAEKPKDTSGD
jgi:transposase-like protein